MGHFICNKIGEVIEVDVDETRSTWGGLMRVRVCLDITQPLLHGKKIAVGGGNTCWFRFLTNVSPISVTSAVKWAMDSRNVEIWACGRG